MTTDAERYRLAQANKMIRLGLVEPDGSGGVRKTAKGTAYFDQLPPGEKIKPDRIEYDAIARAEG